MNLLQEIIALLTDDKNSLNSALLKTKVLAYQLDNKKLLDWVNNELNGYEDNAVLPDYRRIDNTVMGSFTNGFTRYSNAPIPTNHLEPQLKEALLEGNMTNSVSNLEYLINTEGDSFHTTIPPEVCAMMSRDFPYRGFTIEFANKTFQKNQVIEIVTQIRSKLLEFILELSNEVKGEELSKISSKKLDSILNTTIVGNNNVFLAGNNNIQKVSIKVKKGDFKSLRNLLKEHNVDEKDINELEKIIDSEKPNHEKEFGPKVKEWLAKMLNKAIYGTWNISLNIAGNLLTGALLNYYGN